MMINLHNLKTIDLLLIEITIAELCKCACMRLKAFKNFVIFLKFKSSENSVPSKFSKVYNKRTTRRQKHTQVRIHINMREQFLNIHQCTRIYAPSDLKNCSPSPCYSLLFFAIQVTIWSLSAYNQNQTV